MRRQRSGLSFDVRMGLVGVILRLAAERSSIAIGLCATLSSICYSQGFPAQKEVVGVFVNSLERDTLIVLPPRIVSPSGSTKGAYYHSFSITGNSLRDSGEYLTRRAGTVIGRRNVSDSSPYVGPKYDDWNS